MAPELAHRWLVGGWLQKGARRSRAVFDGFSGSVWNNSEDFGSGCGFFGLGDAQAIIPRPFRG